MLGKEWEADPSTKLASVSLDGVDVHSSLLYSMSQSNLMSNTQSTEIAFILEPLHW